MQSWVTGRGRDHVAYSNVVDAKFVRKFTQRLFVNIK